MAKTLIISSVIAVAGGGALGAVLRYLLSLYIVSSSFPLATFIVNVVGSFTIGAFSGYLAFSNHSHDVLRLFIQIGLLGGFTTFSTFSLEVIRLCQEQRLVMAGIYATSSMVLCVFSVIAGMWFIKVMQAP